MTKGGVVPHPAMPFRIEYGQITVPLGHEPVIYAQHPDRVKIHNVTQIGPDLCFEYTIVWFQDARDREMDNALGVEDEDAGSHR